MVMVQKMVKSLRNVLCVMAAAKYASSKEDFLWWKQLAQLVEALGMPLKNLVSNVTVPDRKKLIKN